MRLLQKIAATGGSPGFEMSGAMLPPKPGLDLDLASYASEGTAVEQGAAGEFLVSRRAGFLQVDGATSRIAVGDKIVSRDGVSARTTGNLKLSGDYEEFGDVQEKRVVEGESITVHGNVFGSVSSRGGTVLLHANLVGGSAENRRGDIRVRGVASGATLRASDGEVVLERAENCIVSGTRVTVVHAVNCEIIGDEVTVGQAEGGAIAGRRVTVGACAPRKQGEMLVCVLAPNAARRCWPRWKRNGAAPRWYQASSWPACRARPRCACSASIRPAAPTTWPRAKSACACARRSRASCCSPALPGVLGGAASRLRRWWRIYCRDQSALGADRAS